MLSLRWKFVPLIAFLLAGSAWGQTVYNCLPSCASNDARFLAIANGTGFVTLSQPVLDLEISVPRGTTTFTVGIFDGDSQGGIHWDLGSPATFSYTLYADPNRDHAAAIVAPLSGLPVQLSTSMPDNDWIDYTVNTDPTAAAPSGNYFYLLRIQLTTPSAATLNALKVRTGGANVGGSSLFPSPQPFSYIANVFGIEDLLIVYPDFPSVTPTTYDGSFNFYFDQPVSQQSITVWDGDFDYGSYDGSTKDTDDPDTPNTKPSWKTADTVDEGAAIGLNGASGNPPDDNDPSDFGFLVVRPPSIFYDLILPDGQSFRNDNPSGNQEWEQFKVSTDPFDRSQMDYHADAIPAGVYQVSIQGLDMQNLNALLLPGRALCVSETGIPCTPLRPYLLGDTVFRDDNQNGVQDPGEPGIAGVEVDLYDDSDSLIATTTTDADGHYSFGVEAFSYVVKIPASNYGTSENPGILFGYNPTTSEQCPVTITNDNILTCDFGYGQPASVGDRVWSDFNGNGVQDAGEPGINNLIVNLLDSNGNVVATDTTHDNGNYGFGNLQAGTYTVQIDDTSLPGGLTPTYDLDGVATPHQATFTVTAGQNRTDVDFGYQGNAEIGDRVWYDYNSNGVQEPGEPGITGVTVQLYDDSFNLITTTVTGANGHYSFDHLVEGTYTIKVDTATLPADATPTYDFDGVETPDEVDFFTAFAGTTNNDIDFGYTTPNAATASVGDRVWNDVNGDGVQDANETGLNGVTVKLFDSANNLIATAITSGDGNYTFSNLAAGSYTVQVAQPAGMVPTSDLDGVGTANLASFTLATGEAKTDVDFGYQGTASVGDRVWFDINGDGVQDAGEAGINGITVQLLDAANNVIATATTSGDGNYSFSHLTGGTYSVQVVEASLTGGLTPTYDLDGVATPNVASFSLNDGDSRADVDFGYRGTASVGDRVWNDFNGNGAQDAGETGLNGLTVDLLDAANNVVGTTTTSGDGNYTFSYLRAGTYTVRVTPTAGLSPTYDLDGVATANVATFTLAAGDTKTDVDFGYQGTASVGDRVWLDSNGDGVQDADETGINGVTVELLDAANNVVGTATTSGDGNYTFNHLTAGHYTVRVVSSSLPAGVTPTYDLDGITTANVASFDLAGDETKTDVDFGYRGAGSVGDRLWLDTNGNGLQDAGETGIVGATVQLFDGGNNLIATTSTGADGIYHFDNLVGGTYTVKVVPTTLPAGVTPTYDLDGVATANQATFTLGATSRDDVDFGYQGTASVGDRVWIDTNANGVQDAGETGLNGVTVQLVDSANTVVATATTSGDGNYTFDHLLGGSYSVRVVTTSLPAGLAPTYDLDGIGTANVASFLLDAGANRTDVDFGYRYTGSVGDRIWLDTNANGVQDAGEAGINGVTVELLNGSTVVATATTSGDGNYTFSNLAAGTYTVRVVTSTLPAGVAETYDLDGIASANQATFALNAGQNRTDADFGYRNTGSIGDRVWLDTNANGVQDAGEAGINGVTVELLDGDGHVVATDTTAGNGNYSFTNLAAGTYTVRVVTSSLPEGVAETYDLDGIASADQATFTLNAGQQRTDVDFGYRNTGSIGDRVWLDTNANGAQDAGEAGINGVTVQLLDSGNNVVATTTTSGDGNYTFNNLAAGTYTVKIVASSLPAGVAETYDLDGVASLNQATVTLNAGQQRTDLDFGYRNTGSIGDRVWLDTNANGAQDAGETGLNGVTVQLLDSGNNVVATATTSGDGNYTFSNLAAGTYTVRVVTATLPAGLAESYDLDGIASADQATFTLNAGQQRTDVDFGYRNTGSVGDRVWLDTNADGNQDAGEPGINGVTVQLLNAANTVVATTTTSGNGNYTFANLAAGTYTVKIVASSLPAGVAETYDLDGVATLNQATFTLNAGAERTDVDFGYRPTGSIGDRIWNDGNGNGVQDAGEPGINGVTVQLLDATNNVIATTTTSGNGNYTFNNLPGGTYTVRVVAATLPAGMAETYDLDGVASADQATFALAAGATRTDVDFGYRIPPGNQQYCAIESFSDPALNNGPNGHAFYLPGIGTDFVFTPSPGSFSVNSDGTATLTGTLHSKSDPANGFTVTVTFSGYTTTAPPDSPKKELFASAYVENGGPIDPSTWIYYTSFTGTLTGTGNYAGAVIQLTNTGPAFQVGKGANGKNGNFGGSGWYNWNVVSQPTSGGSLQATGMGDINVDLADCNNIGSVGDRVWNDTNGNGVQDAGENGLNGVTVQLVDGAGNLIASAITAGDGNYSFAYLAGNYSVNVVPGTLPAGTAPTYDLDGIGTPNTASVAIAAGVSRTDVDFGYRGTASIGDRVWNDANGNGIQDAGEAGINGITVQLLDAANNVVATATTSGDGNYTFSNLNAGNYTVTVVASSLPAGTTPTYDLDGVATPNTASFSLAAGANRTDVDFGYKNAGSVGDRVWLDSNGNGVQDAGETGINGVTVQLLSGSTVIATTTTSGDGSYAFNNLTGGNYTVRIVASSLPAGVTETFDLDGVATANQASFTLAAGASRSDVDFGYKYNGSVGDRVWLDTNGNGVQDAGEAGINGVTVQLLDASANVVATATTSGDGNYTFGNLAGGTYTVRIVASSLPAGVAPSFDLDGIATANQATFTLAAGANRTDVDFGYKYTGSVGDRVWLDTNANGAQDAGEAGINGVTVQLLNASGTVIATTTTSGDGNYTFNNLAAGNYTVKIVASSLPAGTAETFDLDGVATLNQASFSLAVGQSRTDVDFGYKYTGSIGDRVWLDANANGVQDTGETGINGVTVQLLDAGGNVIATTATSGNGNYTFSNLAGGSYTVKIVASSLPAGVAPTFDLDGIATANQATFTLAAGANRTDVDFGYKNTGSVGNRVWLDSNGNGNQDAGETGINGVTVQLLSGTTVIATTTTSGDGNYTFANLAPGTYTVKVVSATLPAGTAPTFDLDGIATANQATFSLTAGQNRTDVDFGYRGTLSIGDRVWNDCNGNGVQDAGEAGINGVTVQLLSGSTVIATTTTSGNGNYTFSNLTAGTYTVKVVPPAGTVQTYDLDGLSTANQATVNLTASRTDVDFGYRFVGTLSIGDRVWNDANANGLQDSGEAGISGVTVQLLDTVGNVLATTTTNSSGNYTFTALVAGTYTVKIVTSTLPAHFEPTYDLDGISTPNQATVVLTASRTDVDYGYHFFSPTAGGTGTLGYWKTHPEAWPVSTITIGGITYTKAQAITWLSTPVRGDASIALFQQLVPAELNALGSNTAGCITTVIQAADAWMRQYGPVGSGVSTSSAAGQVATSLQTQLDNYNNGRLCAQHRN